MPGATTTPTGEQEGRRRATIRDVAAAAGVSTPTVSRVLTGSANVTPATRSRVQAAIEALDYQPSSAARALAYGRTMTIGAVVPFVTRPSAVQRVRGFVDGLRASGYPLTLYDVETPTDLTRHLGALTSSEIPMGLIVVSVTPTPAELEALRAGSVPVVFVDVGVSGFPQVAVDHRDAGRIATEHLIALGHDQIAFIGDHETNPFGFASSAQHRQGYRLALAAAGIEVNPRFEATGPHGREPARLMALELLGSDPQPTAIVTASDTQAFGVLDATEELGVEVPADLSVIGFDDIEMSACSNLTTVHQPLETSGRIAAEILLAAIESPSDRPISERLPVELIVRATTGSASTTTQRKET